MLLLRWCLGGVQRKNENGRFRRSLHNALIALKKSGAGEGIRTLDPNLGKVVGLISLRLPHASSPTRLTLIHDFLRQLPYIISLVAHPAGRGCAPAAANRIVPNGRH